MNKVVLWDFDGTLSCPNKSFFSALHTALNESGYNIAIEKTEDFLNKAYSWKRADVLYPGRTGEKWWEDLFAKINRFCKEFGVAESDFNKINSDFKEILTDAGNYILYDDAIRILKKCREFGYNNYLATNNYPEITDNLEKLGVAPYMEACVVSSHIGYEKPRAEFYSYAKELAGNPEMIYMIGDNPVADIIGGKSAGCITVAVHECRNSEADYYFENLIDIAEILK